MKNLGKLLLIPVLMLACCTKSDEQKNIDNDIINVPENGCIFEEDYTTFKTGIH